MLLTAAFPALIQDVPVQDVVTLVENGPSDNRIDLTFVGDGYTHSELGNYASQVADVVSSMFDSGNELDDGDFPYIRYANFFNVHRIDAISNESGTDLQNGPDVDTAFHGGQSAGIARLANADADLVNQVTDQALKRIDVESDGFRALALNTSATIAAGYENLAVYAAGEPQPHYPLLHESAHSYHDIDDEYGGTPGQVYSGIEPDSINVTTDPVGAKWANWIGYNQSHIGTIGVYEGGRYYDEGLYRPSVNSLMRTISSGFSQGLNAPSREQVILDLYDIVDPLDDWLDNSFIVPASQTFWVDSIDPGIFKVEWSVDGSVITIGGESFQYDFSGFANGSHTVTARVYDEALLHAFSDNNSPHQLDLVRRDFDKLQQSVSWTVHLGDEAVVQFAEPESFIGVPVAVQILDHDAAGSQSVTVEISTGGDTEQMTLNEVTPGLFRSSIVSAVGTPRTNGVLDIAEGVRRGTVSANYIDPDRGVGIATLTASADVIVNPVGTVHHFSLNEGSGNSIPDQVGDLTGTVVGANWTTGPMGTNALEFGGDGDRVDLDTDLNPILGGSASVSYWIRTSQTGGIYGWNSPAVVGANYSGSASQSIYWGWIDDTGRINVSSGSWGVPAKSANPINDNRWHRVAMTRNATNGEVSVYVDGELHQTTAGNAGFKPLSITSIGRREDKNAAGETTGGRYFSGSLADVRVYSRILSQQDIDQLVRLDSSAPVAEDDLLWADADVATTTSDVRANDRDSEGDALTVIGFTHASNGVVTNHGNGTFTYQPASGFRGADAFTYTITDGVRSATASVNVNASGANVIVSVTGGRIVVQNNLVMFSVTADSPGLLEVLGIGSDDTVLLDFSGGSLIPPGGLSLDGGDGSNTLSVVGADSDLDFTGSMLSARNFSTIDLRDDHVNVITIDAAVVQSLAPVTNSVSVVGGEVAPRMSDAIVFADSDDWRMGSTSIVDGRFIRSVVRSPDDGGAEVLKIELPQAWQNVIKVGDVNNNGDVTANDALLIINELARRAYSDADTKLLDDPLTMAEWPGIYYDQNGDDQSTALDALRVINELARISVSGGESRLNTLSAASENHSQLTQPRVYDVSGDGYVTSLDALLVINALNPNHVAVAEEVAGVQTLPNRGLRETTGMHPNSTEQSHTDAIDQVHAPEDESIWDMTFLDDDELKDWFDDLANNQE